MYSLFLWGFPQESFTQTLADMPAEEFEKNVSSLVSLKLQKDKSLYDESDRHWDTIWSEQYTFFLREAVVDKLKQITKGEPQEIHPALREAGGLCDVHTPRWFKPYAPLPYKAKGCVCVCVNP